MFSPIEEILDELRQGRMIVLTDDEDRENEGDLVMAAEYATPEAITFMLSEARGYLCLSLTEDDCDRLALHPQAPINTSVRGTPFTVSIDGHPKHGFTTGVSARERARCIALAIDPATSPDDFVRPGHINPLRARDGGVLVRTGQTEGSVDLCALAGLRPAAVILEIMRDDGEMARVPDLEKFCADHNLKMCSVEQIIEHRLAGESLVRRIEPATGRPIETEFGTFTLVAYESGVDPLPHLALTVGGVGSVVDDPDEPVLVRMHRRDLLGDIFHARESNGMPSAAALHASMRAIQNAGRGAIVYLRPEGVGEGWDENLTAIRRSGTAGAPAAAPPLEGRASPARRQLGIGAQILRDLGVRRLRLLTNHDRDLPGLDAFGIEIAERVRLHDLR